MRYLIFIAALMGTSCNLFLDDWGKIYYDAGDDADVEDVDCEILYPPLDGDVDLSQGTTYGKTASYRCKEGYILYGMEQRTCGADGVWSDEPPTCLMITVTFAEENWYDGMETCEPANLMIDVPMGGTGGGVTILVQQIPPGVAGVGDCTGNTPEVTLIGNNRIDIRFDGGGTCHTACWDFRIVLYIPDLPPGEYTVTVGDLTVTDHMDP